MSDAVWLAIIGVVAMVVKELLDHRRAAAAALRSDEKAEAVKTALQADTAKQNEKLAQQDEALSTIAEKVEVVHVATNSLVTKLVEKGEREGDAKEKAGYAAGRLEERERSDARDVRAVDRVEGKRVEQVIDDAVEKKVDSLHAKVEQVPEKVVEKLEEREDQSPPEGTKP